MPTDRSRRISTLHAEALARPPDLRDAFLKDACAGDEGLRREVASLLAYEPDSSRFLDELAAVVMADVAGPESPGPEIVDRQLGPYTIVALLGAGGMGEVYRARDGKLGRDVAIKVLPAQLTADAERRARLSREARVLARLNHPHIGAIYGLEEIGDRNALVLELVEGPTLAERLADGPLPIPEALGIARQVADAIACAHQHGVVHRDLKPANIVLQRPTTASGVPTPAARAKVLDFGLAKTMRVDLGNQSASAVPDALEHTAEGRILGTPAYMSPEQSRGQAVDTRTDVWAFGCVLYEMLAGRPAFDGATFSDTLAAVLEREPEWSALPAATPAAIRTLLRRCLRKDPDSRLHDIADARIEIDEVAPNAPAGPDGGQGTRSRAWMLAGLVLLAVAVAVGAVAWRRAPEPAVEAFEFPMAPPADATFPSRYGGFAVSPDGRQVVVTASADRRASLWIRPLATPDYRQLPGTDGALFPFWKPDGSAIGFFAGGQLKIVDARGGLPTIVCDAPEIAEGSEYDEVGGTWNRDDVIVFMSRTFTLQKVAARAGAVPEPLTGLANGETAHRWPTFLPDGRHFLFLALTKAGEPGDLRVGSLDGAPMTSLGRFDSNARYSAGHLIFLSGDQLVARRFDPTTRLPTGPAMPLVTTSKFRTWNNLGAFSASESGVLAHHPGGPIVSDQRLTWRDRAGRVTRTFSDTGRFPTLDLSPDGTRVAVSFVKGTAASDIWVFDLTRDDGVPVTSDPAWEFDPSWSNDGRRLVFNSNRTEGRVNLFTRPSDGSGRDELVVAARSTAETPVWTPDDRAIVYTDDGDLWVRPASGGQPAVLWKTAARERAGSLSPDGRWIAYTSDRSGRHEIYVRAFPSGETEHKVSVDGGMASRWRGDGKELFFLSLDAALMAARVDTTGAFKAAIPESLFATGISLVTLRPFVVSRDGQQFLVPTAADGRGPPPITLVVNWPARLSR